MEKPTLRRNQRIINLQINIRGNNNVQFNKKIKVGKNVTGTKRSPPKLATHKRNSGSENTTINPAVKEMKREATKLFSEKKYDLAIMKYTLLVDMCPKDAIYYGNRAACYMMLQNYTKALEDAKKSVELSPTFIKGHCRVIRCAIKLHEFLDMDQSVAKLEELD